MIKIDENGGWGGYQQRRSLWNKPFNIKSGAALVIRTVLIGNNYKAILMLFMHTSQLLYR